MRQPLAELKILDSRTGYARNGNDQWPNGGGRRNCIWTTTPHKVDAGRRVSRLVPGDAGSGAISCAD